MAEERIQSTIHEVKSSLRTDLQSELPSALSTSLAVKLTDLIQKVGHAQEPRKRFKLTDAVLRLYDEIIGGSPILPVPEQLAELVRISNRIVSFVLDERTHFGTGVLVGPSHVLTAAHLFFDQDGRLTDRQRAARVTVEAHTTFLGNVIVEGPRTTTHLYARGSDDWLIDPKLIVKAREEEGQKPEKVAHRDVDSLDFAIVKLEDPLGDDDVGHGIKRGWFEIPTAAKAQLLSTNLCIRVFQFLDREALLSSSGFVRNVSTNGLRVLHTASTADSASGAAMVDDEFNLIGLHLGGCASGERPKSNRGLPIRRVAEVIDQVRQDGTTVRSELT